MCTLTWWSDAKGRYDVFFNRDELKDREPAVPPAVFESGEGVRFLAPIDPRGGGTWLAVNEAGITVALLNWYGGGPVLSDRGDWRSRGGLVLDLAGSIDRETLRSRVGRLDAGNYPPFRLAAFFPPNSGTMAVEAWEGNGGGRMLETTAAMPMCSSSFETAAVIEGRRKRLDSLGDRAGEGPDPDSLWAYHQGADATGETEPPSAWTVRMNRPDAQTWSVSRITVTPDRVRFHYEAEPANLEGQRNISEAALERRAA